jgi:hypothetical protein
MVSVGGVVMRIVPTTHDMDTAAFMDYVEKARVWLASKVGSDARPRRVRDQRGPRDGRSLGDAVSLCRREQRRRRGVKPKAVEKRLKALFFGAAGVGKTTAAIQFPRPYLIDTEKGAENDQYVEILDKRGGAVFQTSDFDELLKEVTSLLTEKHEYRTLIIDPLTVVYNELLDKSAKSLATREDPTGTAFSRHKGPADRKLKHLLNLLLRLDMNVIITSHAKGEWKNGQPTGHGHVRLLRKLDYLFDLVFSSRSGAASASASSSKTRCKGFPEGETFPFSYDQIAEMYGREVLERVAKAERLATPSRSRTSTASPSS